MSEITYRWREVAGDPLHLAFAAPVGWKARETVRAGDIDIHLLGPRNKADTYSVSLAIRAAFAAGRTAKAAAQELLTSLHDALDCESSGPYSTTTAGQPAFQVDSAYELPLPLNSVLARPTLVREVTVFFRWEDQLMELRYAAAAEDFAAWQPAFESLLSSLRVGAGSLARPLAVHESREHYDASRGEDDGSNANGGN